MKARLLIFPSALSFMLLAMTAGLRAQPQETGAAARRVIIFVWDGLRGTQTPGQICDPVHFDRENKKLHG